MRAIPALIILAFGLALQILGIAALVKGPTVPAGVVCLAAGIVCYCGLQGLIGAAERCKETRAR